jgi:tRNA A37 threonylcarbamoyladenosine dehydratase
MTAQAPDGEADLERRFGGLRRLWGEVAYQRMRAARVAVVGLGGVGSWAVEALARSGVAELVLIDLDHVVESNINRQVQALGSTLGMAKAQALRARVADIHPGCRVHAVEEFASDDNWPELLPAPVDAVIDACDQSQAKLALARWALDAGVAYACCGAAGGKREAQRVEVADLGEVTHDPLLASLRQRLRKSLAAASGPRSASTAARGLGVRCVFSREAVAPPPDAACAPDGGLNCHGYGSTVTVTATFGLVAAGEVTRQLIQRATGGSLGSC